MNRFTRCLRHIGRRAPRALRRSSLHHAFTVPVLVQISVAVGLVGYLSLRNGEQAVQSLASQLRSEVSKRIDGELKSYFGDPHAINRLNATAFSHGDLAIEAAHKGEHLLFQQMKIYPEMLSFIVAMPSRESFLASCDRLKLVSCNCLTATPIRIIAVAITA